MEFVEADLPFRHRVCRRQSTNDIMATLALHCVTAARRRRLNAPACRKPPYFVAYLVLRSSGIKPNQTNPYAAYKNQKPFGTVGAPDIVATLGAAAKAALNAVWYQKWIVHLRHRPKAGSGLVYLMMTKPAGIPLPQAPVHEAVLDSAALYFSQFVNHDFGQSATHGSFLLSQAFPEGSPTDPSYPAGHGAVAGACITVLKFFFDGDAVFEHPVVPSADGLALEPYTGSENLTSMASCTSLRTICRSATASTPGSTGAMIPIDRSSSARRSRSEFCRIRFSAIAKRSK